MLTEIRPEPSDEERAAIVAALEQLLSDRTPDGRAPEWWSTGLNEGLAEDEGT